MSNKATLAGGLIAAILGFLGLRRTPETDPLPEGKVTVGTPRIVSSTPAFNAKDHDALARTVWGEARGEGYDGMRAVAAVIMNRVKSPRYPNNAREVCFQPWQFSVWNKDEPNGPKARAVTDKDLQFKQALVIAEDALTGQLKDLTGGATHYHATYVEPFWAKHGTVSARIGQHIFYTGVK